MNLAKKHRWETQFGQGGPGRTLEMVGNGGVLGFSKSVQTSEPVAGGVVGLMWVDDPVGLVIHQELIRSDLSDGPERAWTRADVLFVFVYNLHRIGLS